MSDTVEVLRKAKKLLEKGWTQGASARSWNDIGLDGVHHPAAAKWCALGAIARAGDSDEAINALALFVPPGTGYRTSTIDRIVDFNDDPERKQEEVLMAFDWAIAMLDGREA